MTTAEPPATAERGRLLLRLARDTLIRRLESDADPEPPADPWLLEPAATFVTVKVDGQLRGCIGALHPRRPLAEDVIANTGLACFGDHRFPPIQKDELERTRLEISLLSPMEPLRVKDQADLLRQLRPGIDGLYYECLPFRAVFLPQVWESLPKPEEFVARLKQKGGLAPDEWPAGIRWWRFGVQKFVED